jgi:hypothetical protein
LFFPAGGGEKDAKREAKSEKKAKKAKADENVESSSSTSDDQDAQLASPRRGGAYNNPQAEAPAADPTMDTMRRANEKSDKKKKAKKKRVLAAPAPGK